MSKAYEATWPAPPHPQWKEQKEGGVPSHPSSGSNRDSGGGERSPGRSPQATCLRALNDGILPPAGT